MRRDLAQIHHDAGRVRCVGIWLRGSIAPPLNVGLREALESLFQQAFARAAEVWNSNVIYWKPCRDGPPFGTHVGDRKTRIHRQAGDAGPAKFHSRVERLIV